MEENTKSENEQTPPPLTKGERDELVRLLAQCDAAADKLLWATQHGNMAEYEAAQEAYSHAQIRLTHSQNLALPRLLSTADQWDVLRAFVAEVAGNARAEFPDYDGGYESAFEAILEKMDEIAGTPSLAASSTEAAARVEEKGR